MTDLAYTDLSDEENTSVDMNSEEQHNLLVNALLYELKRDNIDISKENIDKLYKRLLPENDNPDMNYKTRTTLLNNFCSDLVKTNK